MNVIEVKNLTKDYGFGRGVFDISFNVRQGEVYGFLGPNGAGKSTTIRHLMGFSKPQKGQTKVLGKDSFRSYYKILRDIGYIPGEIALPAGLTGWEFLDMTMRMKRVKSNTLLKKLLDIFELDPTGETKRMSLGDKRKLAIVAAFVGDPQVLILDEPTSGLDPVMQEVFISFIKLQKSMGKTIMLSSHMFDEIDATCDTIAIIKDGVIVSEFKANDLRHATLKTYSIALKSQEDFDGFLDKNQQSTQLKIVSSQRDKFTILFECEDDNINQVLSVLSSAGVVRLAQKKATLEDYFMKYYVADKDFGGVL